MLADNPWIDSPHRYRLSYRDSARIDKHILTPSHMQTLFDASVAGAIDNIVTKEEIADEMTLFS